MGKPFIYVDTDVGLGTPGAEIDDAAALIILLTSKELHLAGAGSVYGNVPCLEAIINLNRICSFCKRDDVPLGHGATLPLLEGPDWFAEWQANYRPTLPFPVPEGLPSSAQLMIDLVKAHPGEITLLSIGPMTNLALAARLQPDFVPLVKEVVAMGGSYGTDVAIPEFNIRSDPESAHIVFNAGWKLTLLGLNLTRRMVFTKQEFADLKGTHPATQLLKEMAPLWISRMEEMGWEKGGCALHDAVAVAYILDKSLFESRTKAIRVELHDLSSRGITCFSEMDSAYPQATVVVDVDVKRCHDRIWSYIQHCEE